MELPDWASELLAQARVGRLGLLDLSGAPRVQPITFVMHDARLWSAIDAKPKSVPAVRLARVRFLAHDPRVALTVDDYEEDWQRLRWVQVLGRGSVVQASSAPEAPAALAALAGKYPQYRGAPPPGPLLAIEPQRCLCWSASEN
jgi:PPOX class probable F420-dependent enzyme